MSYEITRGSEVARRSVEAALHGLDLVSPQTRELIVTAWVSSLESSPYGSLDEVPWDVLNPRFRLIDHVNETTRIGLELAAIAERLWGKKADIETLASILILHDVDKPLLIEREGNKARYAQLASEIPHGVVGGMMLKELGFPHKVVSTVTVHSPRMPFPGRSLEAYILFYADMFSCDNSMLDAGLKPFYFGLELSE
ncbi:MAG: hypothetical protein M9924_19865 [Rhizobiaceae bacterium]|nr:hypothetical protein [Rhizobiaceae bacterium]